MYEKRGPVELRKESAAPKFVEQKEKKIAPIEARAFTDQAALLDFPTRTNAVFFVNKRREILYTAESTIIHRTVLYIVTVLQS